jgi:hypothetical protein
MKQVNDDCYNVSVIGEYLSMRLEDDSAWSHEDLCRLLAENVANGVRYILIDKRQQKSIFLEQKRREDIGKQVAQILKDNNARMAAVLRPDDHLEKIACYDVCKHGGKILSTEDVEEAVYWLNGLLT